MKRPYVRWNGYELVVDYVDVYEPTTAPIAIRLFDDLTKEWYALNVYDLHLTKDGIEFMVKYSDIVKAFGESRIHFEHTVSSDYIEVFANHNIVALDWSGLEVGI